jgi:glutathione S-transferase
MTLELHFHPLSSFSQKVLVALYENATPFEPHVVDLWNKASRAAFARLWPMLKIPVLRDTTAGRVIPETSIIIEYLDRTYPGRTRFLPAEPELALAARLGDRFYDLHVQFHVSKIVFDRLRPAEAKDALGVEQAKAQLEVAYGVIDREMAERRWAAGDDFTLADCAAAPALFYAELVLPFAATHRHAAAYLDRLRQRPSFARAVKEAEPYFAMFPKQ